MSQLKVLVNEALKCMGEHDYASAIQNLGYIKILALQKTMVDLRLDRVELRVSDSPLGKVIHINTEEGCQVRVNCKSLEIE